MPCVQKQVRFLLSLGSRETLDEGVNGKMSGINELVQIIGKLEADR